MNSISSVHASALARQRTDQATAAARGYASRHPDPAPGRPATAPSSRRTFRVRRTQPAGV